MDGRKTPEEYLAEIERSEAARLTIYVGFAAGVGKTYKMLADAHELKRAGVDVVRGYIETHGRKRTEGQIGDLEVIPRRKFEYKGVPPGNGQRHRGPLRRPAQGSQSWRTRTSNGRHKLQPEREAPDPPRQPGV